MGRKDLKPAIKGSNAESCYPVLIGRPKVMLIDTMSFFYLPKPSERRHGVLEYPNQKACVVDSSEESIPFQNLASSNDSNSVRSSTPSDLGSIKPTLSLLSRASSNNNVPDGPIEIKNLTTPLKIAQTVIDDQIDINLFFPVDAFKNVQLTADAYDSNDMPTRIVHLVTDKSKVRLTEKDHTRYIRKKRIQMSNARYDDDVIGKLEDNLVYNTRGEVHDTFEVNAAFLMNNPKHRKILFEYIHDYARRSTLGPHQLFVFDIDNHDVFARYFDRKLQQYVNCTPNQQFKQRAEADQMIPDMIDEYYNKGQGIRDFLISTKDTDMFVATLCRFYHYMVSDEFEGRHLNITIKFGPKEFVSVTSHAKFLRRNKIGPELYAAICVICFDTDFTKKIHYTPQIGNLGIYSLIPVIGNYFQNIKFDYRNGSHIEQLIALAITTKEKDASVADLNGFVSLSNFVTRLANKRDEMKSASNRSRSKGSSSMPLHLSSVSEPDFLYRANKLYVNEDEEKAYKDNKRTQSQNSKQALYNLVKTGQQLARMGGSMQMVSEDVYIDIRSDSEHENKSRGSKRSNESFFGDDSDFNAVEDNNEVVIEDQPAKQSKLLTSDGKEYHPDSSMARLIRLCDMDVHGLEDQ